MEEVEDYGRSEDYGSLEDDREDNMCNDGNK
jgi:hypothetical protein